MIHAVDTTYTDRPFQPKVPTSIFSALSRIATRVRKPRGMRKTTKFIENTSNGSKSGFEALIFGWLNICHHAVLLRNALMCLSAKGKRTLAELNLHLDCSPPHLRLEPEFHFFQSRL